MKNKKWKINWNYLGADEKTIKEIEYLVAKMMADHIWEKAKQIVKSKGA